MLKEKNFWPFFSLPVCSELIIGRNRLQFAAYTSKHSRFHRLFYCREFSFNYRRITSEQSLSIKSCLKKWEIFFFSRKLCENTCKKEPCARSLKKFLLLQNFNYFSANCRKNRQSQAIFTKMKMFGRLSRKWRFSRTKFRIFRENGKGFHCFNPSGRQFLTHLAP